MTFKFTPKADQATMLRLAYDEDYHPQHFTKIYENAVAKIYRIDYPASTLVETSILSFISSGPNAATLLSTALHPHDENLRRTDPPDLFHRSLLDRSSLPLLFAESLCVCP